MKEQRAIATQSLSTPRQEASITITPLRLTRSSFTKLKPTTERSTCQLSSSPSRKFLTNQEGNLQLFSFKNPKPSTNRTPFQPWLARRPPQPVIHSISNCWITSCFGKNVCTKRKGTTKKSENRISKSTGKVMKNAISTLPTRLEPCRNIKRTNTAEKIKLHTHPAI